MDILGICLVKDTKFECSHDGKGTKIFAELYLFKKYFFEFYCKILHCET